MCTPRESLIARLSNTMTQDTLKVSTVRMTNQPYLPSNHHHVNIGIIDDIYTPVDFAIHTTLHDFCFKIAHFMFCQVKWYTYCISPGRVLHFSKNLHFYVTLTFFMLLSHHLRYFFIFQYITPGSLYIGLCHFVILTFLLLHLNIYMLYELR